MFPKAYRALNWKIIVGACICFVLAYCSYSYLIQRQSETKAHLMYLTEPMLYTIASKRWEVETIKLYTDQSDQAHQWYNYQHVRRNFYYLSRFGEIVDFLGFIDYDVYGTHHGDMAKLVAKVKFRSGVLAHITTHMLERGDQWYLGGITVDIIEEDDTAS